MTFAWLSNIVMMCFCVAVLVQSVRLMRSLKSVKDGALANVVQALDASTAQARGVLIELKGALSECGAASRRLAEGKEIAEELGVMIGIANASAERLLETAIEARRAGPGLDEDQAIAGERPAL